MSQQNIELTAPAQRIVVIPIPAASMLVSVDESSKRLAGMHPFAGVAARDGMLSVMFPDVLSVRSDVVGNDFAPNIEALLSVNRIWSGNGDTGAMTLLRRCAMPA